MRGWKKEEPKRGSGEKTRVRVSGRFREEVGEQNRVER